MPQSRAEYYREYRKKRKVETGSTESEFVVTVLHDVAQQLQQAVQQLATVAQQLQHVAQQFSQQSATLETCVNTLQDIDLSNLRSVSVAQQSQQNVVQQTETDEVVKRKGSLPPSFPPSHPPQTPPYSSPLLSPHPPKEKGARKISQSSGELPPDESEIVDDPNSPLVVGKKNSTKDFATWQDYIDGMNKIMEETQSDSLLDAFCNWVEYKRERDVNEFYTRRGMTAEVARFIRRHFEEFAVAEAVTRAIASNWQGWDHKL